MKRILALLLACVMVMTSCTSTENNSAPKETESTQETVSDNHESDNQENVHDGNDSQEHDDKQELSFKGLDDEALIGYVQDNLYSSLVKDLNSEDYFVENVEAVYYPKEYVEALASNSQSNLYFGYTSDELNEQFQGKKYVFTLGDDGQTEVVPMEIINDDVFVKALENVIIGTGVILLCVTVSVISAPAAPAVSVIFAASAETATSFALQSGGLAFVAAAIAKGYETESFSQALKAGVEAGAEGFKWGAIIGAAVGGVKETFALRGATLNGLTMNQAALIQKESNLPLSVIKNLHSMEEYEIYKKAGLEFCTTSSGKEVLAREINWSLKDENGLTNKERVLDYLSPVDENGIPYEMHHIGQTDDAPLAILTKAEHMQGGNNKILHFRAESGVNHGKEWQKQVHEILMDLMKKQGAI